MRVVKNLNQTNTNGKWKTSLDHYACAIRPVAAVMVTRISDFSALADTDQAASRLLLVNSIKLQEYYIAYKKN